jgi:hypothetical protein
MNGEYLMLVSKNGGGIWAIICALICLSEGWGVKFHTFLLPENGWVPLLFKNIGKRMIGDEVSQKLERTRILGVGRHEIPIAVSGSRRRQVPSPDTTLYIV